MSKHVPLLLCAALCLLFAGASAVAADKKKHKETEEQKEARIAAEEEARELTTSGLAFKPVVLRGRLSLNPAQDGDTIDTPAGFFTTKQATYVLKCQTLDFRKTLWQYNNKDLTLTGKIRVQGKYFVAISIEGGGAPPEKPITKLGGL
jgi:hypothetical protein